MTHTRIRSFLLALFLVILTLSLTACYTITLKEKRIDGMGSSITVKLPGNPQKLDFPVPVDPLTQRYFKGSRLYGEIDSGLYVAIYTNSIDTQQMYDDLHISQGQAISQRLNQTAEAAAGAVLSKTLRTSRSARTRRQSAASTPSSRTLPSRTKINPCAPASSALPTDRPRGSSS